MRCPKCNQSVRCGCKSCRKIHGNQPGMMVPIKALESDACSTCGFIASLEEWLDIEYQQLRQPGHHKEEEE